MRNPIIEKLLAKSRRTDIPKFGPGDTIKVLVKIREGEKERLQAFEGVVISRTRGAQPSFTVRKISFGQGVERGFARSKRGEAPHTHPQYFRTIVELPPLLRAPSSAKMLISILVDVHAH